LSATDRPLVRDLHSGVTEARRLTEAERAVTPQSPRLHTSFDDVDERYRVPATDVQRTPTKLCVIRVPIAANNVAMDTGVICG
jgi:hypothetical protein